MEKSVSENEVEDVRKAGWLLLQAVQEHRIKEQLVDTLSSVMICQLDRFNLIPRNKEDLRSGGE